MGNKTLTPKQRKVIDELFSSGGDETAVLTEHNVSARLFRKWMADEVFAAEFEFRLSFAKRKSQLLIAILNVWDFTGSQSLKI